MVEFFFEINFVHDAPRLKNLVDFFIGKYLFVPPNGVLSKAKLTWLENMMVFDSKSFILFTINFT